MKRWKRLLLLGATIIVLPATGIVAHWQYYEYLTRAEFERIRAEGEPVTDEELENVYRDAASGFPHEKAWLAAFAAMEEAHEESKHLVGAEIFSNHDEIPAIGEPWPDLVVTEALLRRYEGPLALLERASARPCPVYFPLPNSPSSPRPLDQHDLRRISRILIVAASVRGHQGRVRETRTCFEMLLSLHRCLEYDPSWTGLIVRPTLDYFALKQIVAMHVSVGFSDSDLARLQDAIREIHYESHCRLVVLGDRISGLRRIDQTIAGRLYGTKESLFLDKIESWTPSSRYAYLSVMRDVMAASRLDWPEMGHRLREAERRLPKAVKIPYLDRTAIRIEGQQRFVFGLLCGLVRRAVARNRAADCAIAIERYRRQHGRLPPSLSDLTPRFLPSVPRDPIDGESLRYRIDPNSFAVYSIGNDELDEGASAQALQQGRDSGYRIPLKEWP